jgi:glycosyltransferase involved in cell wall biosynthesis
VIPVYNEEPRISGTLEQIVSFLERWPHTWEVVISDDGSTDASAELIGKFASRYPNVHLLSLPHRGKGWAVKNGMLAAQGQYRLLCDADLSVPIEQVERLLPPQAEAVDVAIGSREAPVSRRIGEPERRHLMGRVYNALVQLLAVPGVRDTQCGFKCFRGEVVPDLFQGRIIDGFGFDVEVLYRARRAGMSVREFGVDWYYRERSKVRPVHDSIAMTCDLLRMRWRYRRRRRGGKAWGDRK